MKFVKGIFKAYDVRGTYPDQINQVVCRAIAIAAASILSPKTCVVGRDMRNSSPELATSFIEGMRSAGVDVTDVGLISTDGLYFAVGKFGFDFGAMVTASHNPPQYNGLKMCKTGAEPLSSEDELPKIQQLLEADSFKEPSAQGRLTRRNLVGDFVNHIFSFVDISALVPFKIIIDAGNGMAGLIVPELFRKLPGQLVPMYFELDGSFPNHPASPIEPENIEELQKTVLQEKADFGAAFDGDADRMFLVDENANPVGGDMVTALVAKSILEKNPGSHVIYNLICSKAVPEVIQAHGGKPIRTRVGHAFIKKIMKEHNAVFGGEHSGHFYFRDNWFADSGLIAFAVCLELLSKSFRASGGNKTLSRLIAEFDHYYRSGEINSRIDNIPRKLEEIAGAFPGATVDHLDGVTVDAGEFWFNVRPSNTEPLVRLNLEAESVELMKQKTQEVLAILRR